MAAKNSDIVPVNAAPRVATSEHVAFVPIVWGPWRIPGPIGIANNILACVYLTFVLFFSLWPSYADVTPKTMNWSILVTGFAAIFSTLYYFFWAKKSYKGPIVEVEPTFAQTQ